MRRILVGIRRVVDYNVRIRVRPDGTGDAALGCLGCVRSYRPYPEYHHLRRTARHARGLHHSQERLRRRRHGDQRPGSVRGGRRRRPSISTGDYGGGCRLHGCARCGSLPRIDQRELTVSYYEVKLPRFAATNRHARRRYASDDEHRHARARRVRPRRSADHKCPRRAGSVDSRILALWHQPLSRSATRSTCSCTNASSCGAILEYSGLAT